MQEWKHNEKKLAEEYCWAITRSVGDHAAAGQITAFWRFDFSWTLFYIDMYLII